MKVEPEMCELDDTFFPHNASSVSPYFCYTTSLPRKNGLSGFAFLESRS